MRVLLGPLPCIRCHFPVVFAERVNEDGIRVRGIREWDGSRHSCGGIISSSETDGGVVVPTSVPSVSLTERLAR